MKTNAIALMETASSCGGVRHKRYSEQQDKALEKLKRPQQFFAMPQHAWIDENNAENSRHNQEFQDIVE